MKNRIPDSDMRGMYLKDGDKPFYYVKKGILCDKCGDLNSCRKRKTKVKCNVFMPILAFAPPFGNMNDKFNTMRLGKAWVTRAKHGSVIALQHTKTKVIFGHATVVSIVAGDKDAIADEHASHNHLMIDNPVEDSGDVIKKILLRCYGPLFYNSASKLTVINLIRVKEKDDGESSG